MISRFRALLFVLLAMPLYALGQDYVYQTGSPTFSTQIPVEHGFINVNNGDVHLELPIANTPQRGGVLTANARLIYDSRIWKITQDMSGNYSWQPTNVPNSMGGWTILTGAETGSGITSIEAYSTSTFTEGPVGNSGGLDACYDTHVYDNKFTWTDPSGTAHIFNAEWDEHTVPCQNIGEAPQTRSGYATDGSGLQITMSGPQGALPTSYTVTDRNGTQLYPSILDRNGNTVHPSVTSTQSGNQIDLAVPTVGGAPAAHYIITTEQINYSLAFNQSAVPDTSGYFTAIQSLQLPDGSQYQFTYDTGTSSGNYGELTSMTLPTGGVITYGYTTFNDSFQNANRWINSHTANGGITTFKPTTISQCSSSQGCQEQVTVTTPDTKSPTGNDAVYTFSLDKGQIANAGSFATNVAVYQGSASGVPLRTESTSYTYQTIQQTKYTSEQVQITTVKDTLPDAGVATQTQNTFDNYTDLLTDAKVWNYQAGSFAAQPDQDTAYTYQQNASNGLIGGFLLKTATTDGAGNQLSSVNYDYDQRGNQIGQHQWINTTGATLDTAMTYDANGALLTSTAPEGKTTYGHDANDTFVTSATVPTPSSGATLTSQTGYDGATGVVTSTTDPNSQATLYKSFDSFNRAGEIDNPDGGITKVNYLSPTTVSESTALNSTASGVTMKMNDVYGRPSRTAIATGQPNSWYQQDTCYDVNGRVSFQSYRYQGPGFSATPVCSGAGDSYTYDALGRTKQVTHGDGSNILYAYTGRAAEITDENGVSKITQTDAFGRVTTACELSSDATMPASGSPVNCGTDIQGKVGFLTSYSYNPAAFQITVTQGVQARVFTTDSLGRQTSAKEPESGTTSYTYAYNSTGLLVTRTKPQANQTDPNVLTTTQTQYDTLDRPLSVNYSDGTGTKSYSYDLSFPGANSTNVLGRLSQQSAATSSVGPASETFSYDALGRITQTFTCLPSTCGKSVAIQNYTYDFAGNMTSASDGAGETASYGYTPANEVTSITSPQGTAFPVTLFSNVTNSPNGPTSYQIGNGLYNVNRFDSLGRRDGGWVCSGSSTAFCTGGTQLYGFTITASGGRVNQACDTVLGNCGVMGYDGFNRLTSRTATGGNALNDSWTYDRYGNRWSQTASPGGYNSQLSFNTANNQAVGFGYDAAGNLVNDTVHQYSYDAEGNMTAVDGGSTAKYTYDGANHRVRSDIGGAAFELLFNLSGQKVSIWSGTSGAVLEEDTHMGTQPLALYQGGTLYFEHQDWLGTERLLTGSDGSQAGAYTSLPFGDGFSENGTDLDPYHFAALDHDYESGLDHAQYREYSGAGGRWLSPDPYSGSYDWSNPQSLNRYAYVLNNPLSLSDPSGLSSTQPVPCGDIFCMSTTTDSGASSGSGDLGFFVDLGEFIASLFGGGPQFHGSLQPRPNALSKPSTLDCASGFAQRTSIAGGLNKFGIGNNGGVGGFLTGALAGNAASGIVDLLRSGGSLTDLAFSGTRLGLPGAGTTLGNGISGVVQDTAAAGAHAVISAGGELTTLAGTASTVGLTGAEYATGFGEIKFGYDSIAYAGGLVGCKLGVIP